MNTQLAPINGYRTAALGALMLATLGGACGQAGASAAPATGTRPTSGPAQATVAPTPTAAPSAPAATSTPLASNESPPAGSPTVTPTHADPQPPPIGDLELLDTTTPGYAGSWCYDGACLTGPPPPKSGLPLVEVPTAGTELAFVFADSHPFTHATASHARDHDAASTQLVEVGQYYDPYLSEATPGPEMSRFTFDAPPSGDWVLRVGLQFADRGDAVYYWHVVVP
jgi:hypothetical protein